MCVRPFAPKQPFALLADLSILRYNPTFRQERQQHLRLDQRHQRDAPMWAGHRSARTAFQMFAHHLAIAVLTPLLGVDLFL